MADSLFDQLYPPPIQYISDIRHGPGEDMPPGYDQLACTRVGTGDLELWRKVDHQAGGLAA